jgi:hypothetical protein
MAEALRDAFSQNNLTGEQMSDDLRVRRTRGRTCNELLSQRNQPTRQTTLYVPLRIFGCLRSRLKDAHCHNLMHFVHKLMHMLTRTQD